MLLSHTLQILQNNITGHHQDVHPAENPSTNYYSIRFNGLRPDVPRPSFSGRPLTRGIFLVQAAVVVANQMLEDLPPFLPISLTKTVLPIEASTMACLRLQVLQVN